MNITEITKVHEAAYAIYEKNGQWAVHDAAKNGQLQCDTWSHCVPCEAESPMLGGACLVCATEAT